MTGEATCTYSRKSYTGAFAVTDGYVVVESDYGNDKAQLSGAPTSAMILFLANSTLFNLVRQADERGELR